MTIAAPLEEVWAYGMDLSKIPEYNPRVAKVELDGGDSHRAAGVSYQCHLVGGPHRCTEEDVEIVPMARIVTRLAFDTLGIGTLLRDNTVETSLRAIDAHDAGRDEPLLRDADVAVAPVRLDRAGHDRAQYARDLAHAQGVHRAHGTECGGARDCGPLAAAGVRHGDCDRLPRGRSL